jgi:hypothetical protein
MTVKELIELLSEIEDKNQRVFYQDYHYGFVPIEIHMECRRSNYETTIPIKEDIIILAAKEIEP